MPDVRRSRRIAKLSPLRFSPHKRKIKKSKSRSKSYRLLRTPSPRSLKRTVRKMGYRSPARKIKNLPFEKLPVLKFGNPDFMRCSYALLAKMFRKTACVMIRPLTWNTVGDQGYFNPTLDQVEKSLMNYVKKCLNSGKKYIIIPLRLVTAGSGHANVIIIDLFHGPVAIRYDPHGQKTLPVFLPNLLGHTLNDFFKRLKIQYKSAGNLYYKDLVSFQARECRENAKQCKNDPDGWCAMWTIFYIYMRLLFPDLSESEFVNAISEEITKLREGEGGAFTRFIRNWSHRLRDEMIESRLCEGANIEDLFEEFDVLQLEWS